MGVERYGVPRRGKGKHPGSFPRLAALVDLTTDYTPSTVMDAME